MKFVAPLCNDNWELRSTYNCIVGLEDILEKKPTVTWWKLIWCEMISIYIFKHAFICGLALKNIFRIPNNDMWSALMIGEFGSSNQNRMFLCII